MSPKKTRARWIGVGLAVAVMATVVLGHILSVVRPIGPEDPPLDALIGWSVGWSLPLLSLAGAIGWWIGGLFTKEESE